MKTKLLTALLLLRCGCRSSPNRFPSTTTTARASRNITPMPGASNNSNQIQNSILAQVAQQDINSAMQSKGLQMVRSRRTPTSSLPRTAA